MAGTKKWWELDPAELSMDQLAEARQSAQEALDQQNLTVAPLQQVIGRLNGEINDRFGYIVPGVPPISQMAPWPTDFVSTFDWPKVNKK